MSRPLHLRLGVAAGFVAIGGSAVALAFASFGGATTEAVGDTLFVFAGSVDDHDTTYSFTLNAEESGPRAGEGKAQYQLSGPGLSLCVTTVSPTSCGTASFQAVSIKGCKATIEAHGTSHSDFPHDAIYNGSVTLEVEFRKKGPNSGELKLNVYTPKAKIEVRGEVTTGNPITMSSCP